MILKESEARSKMEEAYRAWIAAKRAGVSVGVELYLLRVAVDAWKAWEEAMRSNGGDP